MVSIKTKEEFDRKLLDLAYLDCECRPHTQEQRIRYKELTEEVLEYDKYLLANLDSVVEKNTKVKYA